MWRVFTHGMPHTSHPNHLRPIHPQRLYRRSAGRRQTDDGHSQQRGSGRVMLQGVSGAGFENCELIDSFQQTIELREFRGPELMLNISGQELV
jgi:hypothetical protein